MVVYSPGGSSAMTAFWRRLTSALQVAAAPVTGVALMGIVSFVSTDPSTPVASIASLHANVAQDLFETADGCMACHNGLTSSTTEDVSIGTAWRASMMANSARDPYWQASVRREVLDHPERAAEIEDECSTCHMPMMRFQERLRGRHGGVFAHLPIDNTGEGISTLAGDGVSCTLCHQIVSAQLGTPASFNGGFTIETQPPGRRPVFGPYAIDDGRQQVMHSASGYVPTKGDHIRSSAFCATCHTLYTKVFGADGQVVGQFPEQVPFLEWKHSGYTEKSSCQSCHMPTVSGPIGISSVLGPPREALARHDFRGSNFFMLAMLNKYRDELGVTALPQELDASVRRTTAFLERETARLTIDDAHVSGGRLEASVIVGNLTGHKLPTAYPSRRAWLHVTVRDRTGERVFESGAIGSDGAIKGNNNDSDSASFEPHYRAISREDEVQIYESIMHDTAGRVTTGLLSALRYAKDNRLLPEGFNKESAAPDVAVLGGASSDADFMGGSDRVTYSIDLANKPGPFEVTVELRFQPVAFRWARNLSRHGAEETARFVAYYDAMASASSIALASSTVSVR